MSISGSHEDLAQRAAAIHAGRVLAEGNRAIMRAGLGHTIGVRPLTQLEMMHVQRTIVRDRRRLRRRALCEWLLKGLIAAAIILSILGAVYAVTGPQKWMPVGGFVWAAIMRGWWRAKP